MNDFFDPAVWQRATMDRDGCLGYVNVDAAQAGIVCVIRERPDGDGWRAAVVIDGEPLAFSEVIPTRSDAALCVLLLRASCARKS